MPQTKPPKAVVFDIGNVLIHWSYKAHFISRFGAEATARFLSETDILEIHERADAGAPFKETIMAYAQEKPDFAEMIHAWVADWRQMAGPEVEGTADILYALKERGVPVFALSNFAAENYEWSRAQYPVLQAFDQEFISGRLKQIKPNNAIYQTLETTTGLGGSDLYFIDDLADNIATARSRGWHGHLFRTAAELRAELREIGLL